MKAFKRVVSLLFSIAWVIVCFEVSIWAISSFKSIYSIEMIKYAMELKIPSSNPLVTHEHRPNSQAKLMGVDVALNSLGHRSSELKKIKGKNEKRIYVLGSSMGMGWGVPLEDTFPIILTEKLNTSGQQPFDFVAINAGVGNYNTFYQVELFKKQVNITKPDLAIIQFYLNDAEPNPQGEISSLKVMKYSLFAALTYQYIKLIMVKASGSLPDYYSNLYIEGNASWENAKKALKELKAICDAKSIPLYALLIPELQDLSPQGPFPLLYKKIGATFSSFEIPMVNPFDQIQASFGRDSSRARVSHDDPHPSAPIHHILADELFSFLKDKKF
jgi:hypothetical protein